MIEIDGSYSEGGGQMLRTALGLSAITGKAFNITNIRKGRCDPGIKEQHLQAIKAVAKLCNASYKHAELHSERLEFSPKKIRSGNISVNISTAGSVGLVLQSLLIPAIETDLRIRIKGGATYGKWAAPVAYFQNVLSEHLSKSGYKFTIKIEKEGFYPKGGALVSVDSGKAKLKPINILEKGKILEINGISVASSFLKKSEVAERQAKEAKKILFDHFKIPSKIKIKYSDSLCPGTGIQLWIKTEGSILGASGLGERGKKAEIVGKEAADTLIHEYEHGCVDHYAGDQLLPYMALAGKSAIKPSRITNHIKTNIYVIEKFLKVKFKIKDNVVSV